MTIQLSAPKKERDYFNAGFKGILAVLEALSPAGPNVPNVLSNLKSAFGSLSVTPEDDAGHRAWVWAFKTLNYAVSDVLKTQRIKAPLSRKKDEAVKEFLEAATQFEGQELDEVTLKNPGISALFDKAHEALGPMILKATTGFDLGLDTLDEHFKQALRTGSNRTLCEDPSYFRVLEEALTGIAGEGARRDGHWARHAHWISHYYTDAPIFSPDEEEIIPLEAVYLPLRCFWHQIKNIEQEDGTEEQIKTAFVADLHRTIHDWLNKDPRHDPVRVVTGGPGSGKSSFARAFAHEVIQSGKQRVLFVQLQHMTLTGSLHDDIARYVDRRDTSTGENGSPGLPGNPLDWRKTDNMPVLMIFDGLDELSTREEDSERYARELLLALKLLLLPLNTDGTPVRALVLGRNLACQAAMSASDIRLEHMLNVAPIAKMNAQTCMVSSLDGDEIQDPGNLIEADQREDYWRKWAALQSLDPDTIPVAVTATSMEELNVEPLLLHLLLLSKYSGDGWQIAADNKNVVYEDILQKIFERNKNKDHFQAAGVDQPLFFEFMECLGIAAWRGNGRTGDEEDFRQIRKLYLNREKKFRNFHAASLKSVALNIHTRAGQDDASSGFEFIHKSFGEYLAARGLLSYALKTAAELETIDPEDVEQSWCQIIGVAELTYEIIDFLYNEARLKLTQETAVGPKDSLTDLINWVLVHGFSVHKLAPELSWTDLAARHSCSVSALLASTSAVATAIPIGDWDSYRSKTPWTVNIDWLATEKHPTIIFTNELSSQATRALRRINLNQQMLWNFPLISINLEGADMRESHSIWSLLVTSNLENANLDFCMFTEGQLKGVHLKGCSLVGAIFDKAHFVGVDMRHCDLRDASFVKLDASSRDGFRFHNTYTELHIMSAVDFEGADLTGADLSGADLSGALNLSINALNSAIGTFDTKLPDDIDRNKVIWSQEGYPSEKTDLALHQRRERIHKRRHPKSS